MTPRNRLPHHTGRPCQRLSGFACDGRCQAPDQVVADVLTGMMQASFTTVELTAWHEAATAAMLPRTTA